MGEWLATDLCHHGSHSQLGIVRKVFHFYFITYRSSLVHICYYLHKTDHKTVFSYFLRTDLHFKVEPPPSKKQYTQI